MYALASGASVDPMKTVGPEQVSDLERLCFKHWLCLMLATLADAPSPDFGIHEFESTRMDVLRKALTCPRCSARHEPHLPSAALGAHRGDPKSKAGGTHRRRRAVQAAAPSLLAAPTAPRT